MFMHMYVYIYIYIYIYIILPCRYNMCSSHHKHFMYVCMYIYMYDPHMSIAKNRRAACTHVCMYVYMYAKSSVMAVLGCNSLRCVINIILSLYVCMYDPHLSIAKNRRAACTHVCMYICMYICMYLT
jgi:hypothetical protein